METVQELLNKAEALMKQALVLQEDANAPEEQKQHIPQMLKDAQAFRLRAEQLDGVLKEAAKIGQLKDAAQKEAGEQEQAPGEQPSEFKAWNDFLFAIWQYKARNERDPRLTWFDERSGGHEEKQMSGATGASGGFLMPVQQLTELQGVLGEGSIVRSRATILRMTSRQLNVPVLDQTGTTAGVPHWFGGMKFFWTGEGEEKDETEPKFRQVTLVAKKLIGYTYASDELVADSAISLADFLAGPLGFYGGIQWMEDFTFLMGVGGGQPRGVINAPATIAVARQTAGQVNVRDILRMRSRLLPSANAVWVISQSVMESLLQLAGPTGNPSYIWLPSARDGVPGVLLGMPVIWSEKVPLLGIRGDIGLFDFRYYLIGDRQATTIDTTQFDRWVYDETSWRAVHRIDGQPWLSAPLTYQDGVTQVSPFVVLDTATGS